MAYYNKAGLLVLSSDRRSFLVCQKSPDDVTAQFIMPGGSIEAGESAEQTIVREIEEELSTIVDAKSLKPIGTYTDVAAGQPDRDVSIQLYEGTLAGEPKPSNEIKKLHWIGAKDLNNENVSPIIRNKILPDLIKREIVIA
ncbi:MAG: NUDIX domain-containing protein [Candidatus Andersenbacteria bacterium]